MNGINFTQDDKGQKATIHTDHLEIKPSGHVSDNPGKTTWISWEERVPGPFFMRQVTVFLSLDDLKHLHQTIGDMIGQHE